jgi:sugar phosphate isomerase/epimerase
LRFGLDHAENQEPRLDHIKSVMDLSFDLGPRRVILQAGPIPDEEKNHRGSLMPESLEVLGRHGDRVGVVLALETGLEPGAVMARMLGRFNTGGLGVNFDPANLLMNGFDLYESLEALSGRIVHSHAHDARISGSSRTAQEVPIGHGDIDWLRYLSELEQHGYNGWMVIEQERGDRPLDNIAEGVQFLRRLGIGAD